MNLNFRKKKVGIFTLSIFKKFIISKTSYNLYFLNNYKYLTYAIIPDKKSFF